MWDRDRGKGWGRRRTSRQETSLPWPYHNPTTTPTDFSLWLLSTLEPVRRRDRYYRRRSAHVGVVTSPSERNSLTCWGLFLRGSIDFTYPRSHLMKKESVINCEWLIIRRGVNVSVVRRNQEVRIYPSPSVPSSPHNGFGSYTFHPRFCPFLVGTSSTTTTSFVSFAQKSSFNVKRNVSLQ